MRQLEQLTGRKPDAPASAVLNATLVMVFITRIHRNLRERDARLAAARRRRVEEEHIVRIGLLASGAAHELGTPLATLSVLIGDWKRLPAFRDDLMLRARMPQPLQLVCAPGHPLLRGEPPSMRQLDGIAAALPDRKAQRKADAAAGLVPFACKLPAPLAAQLRERAAGHPDGLNGLVAELLARGLA